VELRKYTLPEKYTKRNVLNFTYRQVLHSKLKHVAYIALSVFMDLRIDNDFCFINHELIGIYNRGGKFYNAVRTDYLYKADYN
jgi:hypothetical protein